MVRGEGHEIRSRLDLGTLAYAQLPPGAVASLRSQGRERRSRAPHTGSEGPSVPTRQPVVVAAFTRGWKWLRFATPRGAWVRL